MEKAVSHVSDEQAWAGQMLFTRGGLCGGLELMPAAEERIRHAKGVQKTTFSPVQRYLNLNLN